MKIPFCGKVWYNSRKAAIGSSVSKKCLLLFRVELRSGLRVTDKPMRAAAGRAVRKAE